MNKFESKYFNTARCMDEALIYLLSKKDFELITIKEICAKAGVNRSTFYLHYEKIDDLFRECVEYANKSFYEKYQKENIDFINVETSSLEELVLINKKYLQPYLEFVKDNKNLFKIAYIHKGLLNVDKTYSLLFNGLLNPILEKFGFDRKDNEYIMEYYINGTMALIMHWIDKDCKESIDKIIELIILCVRPEYK